MSFSARLRAPSLTPGRSAGILVGLFGALLAASPAAAQTDYYNTDRGRPLRIEDAYATERFALDLHLAPLTIERRDGRTEWSLEPEVAYGLLPRTQLEVGLPIAVRDDGTGRRAGLSGLDVSALYNVNAETTWPAFGVRAGTLIPFGRFAPARPHASLQGIATRSFRSARLHANVAYTFGDEPARVDARLGGDADLSRWTSGIAIDKTFPLQSLLLAAEVYAAQPLADGANPAWHTGAGMRYQLTPYYSVDAGLHRKLTGDDRGWSVTFGVARVVGVRVLSRGDGRWGR